MSKTCNSGLAALLLVAVLPVSAVAQELASHPPEADAKLGTIAYRYLRDHGWWPARVLGTVSDPDNSVLTLIVIEWGTAPVLVKKRYYRALDFYSGVPGWTLARPNVSPALPDILILDEYGKEVRIVEVALR